MDVVGVDIGFGFTKATDGKESILFKSVLGEATDIQFRLPVVKSEAGPCMHVEIDGRAYFVGDFASSTPIRGSLPSTRRNFLPNSARS